MDINGKMRDAVPVEKEKATLAFENTNVAASTRDSWKKWTEIPS